MNDTPEDVRKIQMQIWLSKSPAERLLQCRKDNDDLMIFFESAKKLIAAQAKNKIPSKWSPANRKTQLGIGLQHSLMRWHAYVGRAQSTYKRRVAPQKKGSSPDKPLSKSLQKLIPLIPFHLGNIFLYLLLAVALADEQHIVGINNNEIL